MEPLSHANYCVPLTSRLYACKPEANRNSDIDRSRRLRTSGFESVPGLVDGVDDFSLLFDRGLFDGRFPILQEQADELVLEMFEEMESLDFSRWDYCEDDYKECEIPNDWCITGETIDVLEYLGVTRVKPLC